MPVGAGFAYTGTFFHATGKFCETQLKAVVPCKACILDMCTVDTFSPKHCFSDILSQYESKKNQQ